MRFAIYRHEGNGVNTLMDNVTAKHSAGALLLYWKWAGVTENAEQRKYLARKAPRLSYEMWHVLQLAGQQGYDVCTPPLMADGKGSQSLTTGRWRTVTTCQRHGWLDKDCKLTQAGREARDAFTARREKRADG